MLKSNAQQLSKDMCNAPVRKLMRYCPLLVVPSANTASGGSPAPGALLAALNCSRRARIAAVAPRDFPSATASYDGAALPTAAAAAATSAELSTETQLKRVSANHPIMGALRNPAFATKLGEYDSDIRNCRAHSAVSNSTRTNGQTRLEFH